MTARAPLRHGLASAFALAGKDLKVAWSYRLSFLFSHVTVVASLVLFYFISRVIGNSPVVGTSDEYFRFIVIGMVLGSLIEHAISAAVGAARRDQVEGTLEAVASLPLSALSLGFSWVAFPIVDSLIGALTTVLLALPLGMLDADPNWISVLVVLLLSVAIFASFGLLGAALVIAFQQGAGVISLALGALGLISGTLFPVSVMPGWLETLSNISPLRHALDGMRAASLDHATLGDISTQLIVLLGFLAVVAPVGIGALELAMRHARRTGGLSRF